MKTIKKHIIVICVLIATLLAGVVFLSPKENNELIMVSRIIDGDTIELSNGERVRYIGIDTPEKGKCYYQEATDYNASLVLNKFVRLEKDTSDKDKYGRLLRYVYIDGLMVNTLLVENGYAVAFKYEPDTKNAWQFEWVETTAKSSKRGLWSACPI